MKNTLLAIATISIFAASSCTKVVNIDLNKSNPQYVVEAEVTSGNMPSTVHLTRSVNFSEANNYPAVTNAVVILSDDASNVDTLIQETPGVYKSEKIKGVAGRTYNLQILVDGKNLTATSKMPQAVNIDMLKMVDQPSFGQQIKAPQVSFHEIKGVGNYYYFVVYRNGTRVRTLYIDNDLANDGTVVDRVLPDLDSAYRAGENVTVNLQSISKEAYDYYFSLQQTIGQSSATPANPVTNINGGNVLGYFSAHTSDLQTLIVP